MPDLVLPHAILAILKDDNVTALRKQTEFNINENLPSLIKATLIHHADVCFEFLIQQVKPENTNVFFDNYNWTFLNKRTLTVLLQRQRLTIDEKYQQLYEHFLAILQNELAIPEFNLLSMSCAELLLGLTPLGLSVFLGHANYLKAVLEKESTAVIKPLAQGVLKGLTPLYITVTKGHAHLVQEILKHIDAANVLAPIEDGGHKGLTPLYVAACHSHTAIVQAILEKVGADKALVPIEDGQGKGLTPLYIAASHGHTATVQAILDKVGADKALAPLTDGQGKGLTPLYVAAVRGHTAIVQAILDKVGADKALVPIEDGQGKGLTPLYVAASHGHTATVQAILEKVGADKALAPLTDGQGKGLTPLYVAASHGHTATVQAILEKVDADKALAPLEDGEYKGLTPLYVAAEKGHTAIVQAILDKVGADKALVPIEEGRQKGLTPLYIAAFHGHTATVQAILEKVGADKALAPLTDGQGKGLTPLFTAAKNGHKAIVQVILEKVDTDKALLPIEDGERKGFTPLYVAAVRGHTAIVQAILEKVGADKALAPLKDGEDKGYTPLYVAAEKGHTAIVQLLLHLLSDKQYARDITRVSLTRISNADLFDICCGKNFFAILISLLRAITPEARCSVVARGKIIKLLADNFYNSLKEQSLELFTNYIEVVDSKVLGCIKSTTSEQLKEILARFDYHQRRQALLARHPQCLGTTGDLYAQEFLRQLAEIKCLLSWPTNLTQTKMQELIQKACQHYLLALLLIVNKDEHLLAGQILSIAFPLSITATIRAAESTRQAQAALGEICKQLQLLQETISKLSPPHSKQLEFIVASLSPYQEVLTKKQAALSSRNLTALDRYFASCRKLSPELQKIQFQYHLPVEFLAIIRPAQGPQRDLMKDIQVLTSIKKQCCSLQATSQLGTPFKEFIQTCEAQLNKLVKQQEKQDLEEKIENDLKQFNQVNQELNTCAINELTALMERLFEHTQSLVSRLKQLKKIDDEAAEYQQEHCQLAIDWQKIFSEVAQQASSFAERAGVYKNLTNGLENLKSCALFNLDKYLTMSQRYTEVYEMLTHLDKQPQGRSLLQLTDQHKKITQILSYLAKLDEITIQSFNAYWQRLNLGTEQQLRNIVDTFSEKETDERRQMLLRLMNMLDELIMNRALNVSPEYQEAVVNLHKLAKELRAQSSALKGITACNDYSHITTMSLPCTNTHNIMSQPVLTLQPEVATERANAPQAAAITLSAAVAADFTDKDIIIVSYGGRASQSLVKAEQDADGVGLNALSSLTLLLEYLQLQDYPAEIVSFMAKPLLRDYFDANLYLAYLMETLESIHQQPTLYPQFDMASVKQLRNAIVHKSWRFFDGQRETLQKTVIEAVTAIKAMMTNAGSSYDCQQLAIYLLLESKDHSVSPDYSGMITSHLKVLAEARERFEGGNRHLIAACKGAIINLCEMARHDGDILLPTEAKQRLNNFRQVRNLLTHPEVSSANDEWEIFIADTAAIQKCCQQAYELLQKQSSSAHRLFKPRVKQPKQEHNQDAANEQWLQNNKQGNKI